jgi:putative radical SAM enzyme (TIGR03279 family)
VNNLIKSIDADSIAHEMGIEPGDRLLAINGRKIVDIMDFLYFMDDDDIELVVEKASGEIWELEIEKSFDEALGLNFVNPILDQAQRCSNQCVFCFIDQLPKGLRETLYFKDDDSRLSFLMGNFVTLTNMNDATFERLIDYRISPINVSVHTVNPELRIKMLGNKHAGNIYPRLEKLRDAGIEMNGQVVLCPTLNDGNYLDETIEALSELYPYMFSMAVVPIGLTKFREGLFEATPVDSKRASDIIDQIEAHQKRLLATIGTRFVFAADEFFLKAGRDIPPAEYYEGYVQIENGVGLLRKLEDEVFLSLKHFKDRVEEDTIAIATSVGAKDLMERIAKAVMAKHPKVVISVHVIENRFFGSEITVAGLITATDLILALKGTINATRLLLPEVMVNTDQLFLDDLTINDLEVALGLPVELVPVNGEALVACLLRRSTI